MKKIHIIGGGTFSHVRSHLALAAPAFGNTAIALHETIDDYLTREHIVAAPIGDYSTVLHLTKMADPSGEYGSVRYPTLVTNSDVSDLVDILIADPKTKVIFFNVALVDFDGQVGDVKSEKYAERLKSRDAPFTINLHTAEKIVGRIRKSRKDIYLVAFKTTAGASEDQQYIAGLNLLKENSINLVLANDIVTRRNMIIVPEEARYNVTYDRKEVLDALVDIALARCQLNFTRSTVVPGTSVKWNDVPATLKKVVDHCIQRGAYKPFRGNTAGHFAYRTGPNTFVTSKRKTNYNNLESLGMVSVEATGRDTVIAHGAKPSVGGQSQRIIFKEHDLDYIVHFHCPPRAGIVVPTRDQRPFECGSHECGQNTSSGLEAVSAGIKAVYLDNHGPNIVFGRDTNPDDVISYIEQNFDLSQKTGGSVGYAHA